VCRLWLRFVDKDPKGRKEIKKSKQILLRLVLVAAWPRRLCHGDLRGLCTSVPTRRCPCAGSRGRPAAKPPGACALREWPGMLCTLAVVPACTRCIGGPQLRRPVTGSGTPRVPRADHAASGKSAQHGALSSRPVWSPQGACSDSESEARSQVRALAPLNMARRYLIHAGMRMPLRAPSVSPQHDFRMARCRTGPICYVYGVLKTVTAFFFISGVMWRIASATGEEAQAI
jgi:hypothetical protein